MSPRLPLPFGPTALAATAILLLALATPAQTLQLPPRPPSAMTGSEFLPLISNLPLADREALLWQEITAGNVPSFLRRLIPVTVTRRVAGTPRTLTFHATPDYLAVGSDADFFRMPMTPRLAQQIATLTSTSLPTRRMVDAIHSASTIRLAPTFFSPTTYTITSPAIFHAHHQRIEALRAGQPLGPLTSGLKKDVVISPLIASFPGRVVIYGWHQLNGSPIQPLSKVHTDTYVDYSHGIRLVHRTVTLDGTPTDLHALLANPTLAPLLSDEGSFTSTTYPTPPAPEPLPLIDAFPSTGPALTSWTPRFTPPTPLAFQPSSPGGDGHVIRINDPAGGTDTLRLGARATRDVIVQADLYCDYRPQLTANGYERIGLFIRDNANGSFDGTLSTRGACYALTWDSDDGRLRCMKAANGTITDLLPSRRYLPSTAWRRFRIEARASELTFLLDGEVLLTTHDLTFPTGTFGLAHREAYTPNSLARGTLADNFFADVPDALTTALTLDQTTGALRLTSTRGVPGHLSFRALTLQPGTFPNGPFFGLDLPVQDALQQFLSGHPAFLSAFSLTGTHTFQQPAPLPPGLTLCAVTLELDLQGRLSAVSPPVSLTLP